MTKWTLPAATLVLGLVLGSSSWIRSAEAQAPASARCVTLFGGGLSQGEKAFEQERPLLGARYDAVAPLAERWTNEQIAQGRTRFFASAVAVNASVVCAW